MNRAWVRLKILIIQDTDWLKRNPAQQHHLAEMLALRGHKIRVIDFEILWKIHGSRELNSKRKIFRNVSKIHSNARITVIRPSMLRLPLLDYVSVFYSHKKEVERQIREFKPDVMVSLGIITYIAGTLAKRNDIPLIYYWIDTSHRLIPFKPLQPIGWMMERRALKLAEKIFVINTKLGEYVIRNGADPRKTVVLGAGIDFSRFNPNVDRTIVRKQFGFKDEDVVVFFVGWLYRFSGLREVARQLCKLKNNKIKLLIVGDGDLYDELEYMRGRYCLQSRLILAGRRPYSEIPKFIVASDICILPAYPTEKIMQDIVPIKMYEYMACGKPVIATRLPGVMKEFREGNGVVYVDRPEDVLEKATVLAKDREIMKEIGINATKYVQKYSWGAITDQFETILEGLVKQYVRSKRIQVGTKET